MHRLYIRAAGAAAILLLWCLQVSPASAEQVHYIGGHPTGVDGDEFCYIEVPHVHVYKPAAKHAKTLYRVHDNTYHFVGDPVGVGRDGEKFSYYGHHPIHVKVHANLDVDLDDFDDDYCYLDGPHYHGYAPPPHLRFKLKGGAYWYVGKFSPRYRKHKKRYARINAVYRPLVYERPVVVVEERPPEYVGPIVEVEAVVPAVVVPRVEVHVPTPTLEVEVGVPGAVIIGGHKKHRKHRKHRKYKKLKKHKRHRW